MTNILITGAYGFLGRNLIKAWHDKKQISGLDTYTTTNAPVNLEEVHSIAKFYICDIQDELNYLEEVMSEFDIIIHAAARTRIPNSWYQYREYYDVNIRASQDLFKIAQKCRVKKFIYVSSSSVYGNSKSIMQSEHDNLVPTNPYAVSKLAAEHALRVQALQGDTELVIVRPFTMYGDYMNFGPDGLVVAKFLKAWQEGHPLLLDGGGYQTRDFVHVSDAISAIELIIEHSQHGDVFNIGSGKSISIKQIADTISHRQVLSPDRIGSIASTCADISKLVALGYNPKIELLSWLTEFKSNCKIKQFNEEVE
jgi:UDP-glucose 4-epimerase